MFLDGLKVNCLAFNSVRVRVESRDLRPDAAVALGGQEAVF